MARSCQFGATRLPGGPVIEVRRRLPPLSARQLRRLPRARQVDHARWLDEAAASVPEHDLRDQARRLALSIVDLGEDREATERQLRRWRFHPTLAGDAAEWAVALDARRRAARPAPGPGDDPSPATEVADMTDTADMADEAEIAEIADDRRHRRLRWPTWPTWPTSPR